MCASMGSNHEPLSYQESPAKRDLASRDVLPVGRLGIEPSASFLSGKRSADELATLQTVLYLSF